MAQASRALKAAQREIAALHAEKKRYDRDLSEALVKVGKLEVIITDGKAKNKQLIEQAAEQTRVTNRLKSRTLILEEAQDELRTENENCYAQINTIKGREERLLDEIAHLRHMNLCAVLRAEPGERSES